MIVMTLDLLQVVNRNQQQGVYHHRSMSRPSILYHRSMREGKAEEVAAALRAKLSDRDQT